MLCGCVSKSVAQKSCGSFLKPHILLQRQPCKFQTSKHGNKSKPSEPNTEKTILRRTCFSLFLSLLLSQWLYDEFRNINQHLMRFNDVNVEMSCIYSKSNVMTSSHIDCSNYRKDTYIDKAPQRRTAGYIDSAFVLMFLLELLIRVMLERLQFFRDCANWFDALANCGSCQSRREADAGIKGNLRQAHFLEHHGCRMAVGEWWKPITMLLFLGWKSYTFPGFVCHHQPSLGKLWLNRGDWAWPKGVRPFLAVGPKLSFGSPNKKNRICCNQHGFSYQCMYSCMIFIFTGFLGTTAVFHESLRAGPVHPWKFQNLLKHGSFLSNISPKTGWTHQGHFFGPGGLGGNGYERYHLGEWREFGATLDPRTEGISLLSDDSTHVLFSAMGGERKQMKTVMFQESDWMN